MKTRVLLIGMTGNLGGIEVFVKNLIFNADPNKYDFTIMIGDKVKVPFQKELIARGVKIVKFSFRTDGYKKCLRDIKKIYKEGHYDIIHINLMTYSPFELVKYACIYSNAEVVVHSHNTKYKKGHYKARLMHFVGKMMLKKYSFRRVACVPEAGKYMFGNQPFTTLYNGVDKKMFEYSLDARISIRKELGIKVDDFVFGDIASFLPQKNQDFLIRVFAIIKKKIDNAKLVLVGVGPEMKKCQALAKKLGLAEDVLFLGKREDVARIYSALDVYAMPSLSEGLSIAICEAQANGLPCITSDGVSKESDISGGVQFLGLDSYNKWADAIVSASKRRNKNVRIRSEFDITTAMNNFYNYYDDILGLGLKKKVSVIVPAYNVQKYINRCIESLIGQSYRDIEVLIIDDGSSDNTVEIIKKCIKNDSRIKLITQSHEGPNAARRKGVLAASGDYIMFVDADDYVEKNAVKELVKLFYEKNVDIIRFNARRSNGEIAFPVIKKGNILLSRAEVLDLLLNTYKLNSLCFQIYKIKDIKKAILSNQDIDYGEDFLVNLELHKKSKSLLAIDSVFYNYYENPDSTTHKRDYRRVKKNIKDRIVVSLTAVNYAKQYDDRFRNRTAYNQIRMIKSTIMDVAKVDGVREDIFINDINAILANSDFSCIDKKGLEAYIKTMSMVERVKNRRIIIAIINKDSHFIWEYAKLYRKIMRLRHG